MAQAFVRNWCMKAVERAKVKEAEALAADTVEAFALRWYARLRNREQQPPQHQRILDKDVIPALGAKQIPT
jgi:hypothetical protein